MMGKFLKAWKYFFKKNLTSCSIILCVVTSIFQCHKEKMLSGLYINLFPNSWRVVAALAIVLLNIKLYLFLYWSKEDLFYLRVRGPQRKYEKIFYYYITGTDKVFRLFRNIKEMFFPPADHWKWHEHSTFIKTADPRGSSYNDDHIFLEDARKLLIEKFLQLVNFMKRHLENVNFLKNFLERVNSWTQFWYMMNILKNILLIFLKIINFLWDISSCHAITFLKSIRYVPKIKILLYDLLPLTVSVLLVWNIIILILYSLNENVLNIMQPFPDWRILIFILIIPITLSALLHHKRSKDYLNNLKFWSRDTILECLIVYYSPLDDIVYNMFYASNGILYPADAVEFK